MVQLGFYYGENNIGQCITNNCDNILHARDYHRLLINSAQEFKVEIPQNFGMMGRLYSGHWFLAEKENLLLCLELLNASGSDHDNMEYYYGFDL